MSQHLRAYEMVEGTSPDEVSLMKQQRRIEEAQRLRRQKQVSRQAMPQAMPKDASGAAIPPVA